jgi:hypothetical protein
MIVMLVADAEVAKKDFYNHPDWMAWTEMYKVILYIEYQEISTKQADLFRQNFVIYRSKFYKFYTILKPRKFCIF